MRVIVFGDSIAYGAWDSQGSWADRLKRKLHQITISSDRKHLHQLYNLDIGGETSAGLIRRVGQETKVRKSANWQFGFIFAIGINDTRHAVNRNSPEVELEDFLQNYDQLLSVAVEHDAPSLIVGLTPIAKPEVKFKDLVYLQEVVTTYNQSLKEFAKQKGVTFVDV